MSMACRRLALVLMSLLVSPCVAGTDLVIPEQLQQDAMSCAGEAVQICPGIWTDDDHGLACMTGKRAAFSPRCRVIYDRVAHVIKH